MTYGDGVYKSTNGGGTWQQINRGLTDLTVVALAVDPTSPDEALAKARALGAYLNGAGLALAACTDPVADQDISRQVDYDLRRGLDCLLTGLASQT